MESTEQIDPIIPTSIEEQRIAASDDFGIMEDREFAIAQIAGRTKERKIDLDRVRAKPEQVQLRHRPTDLEVAYEKRFGEWLEARGSKVKEFNLRTNIFDFYVLKDGRYQKIIEYKRRFSTMSNLDDMGGVIMNFHKYDAALRYLDLIPKGEFFFVFETDSEIDLHRTEIWSMDMRKHCHTELAFDLIGRTDRNDPLDTGPMVLMPKKHMTMIGTNASISTS